jgi:hypothetical protein
MYNFFCLSLIQVLSSKLQDPIIGFAKAPRGSLVPPGTNDIGPGHYERPPAACAPQVESTKPTCATIKFGSGYVKNAKREMPDLSEPSPGPGSYVIQGGINQSCAVSGLFFMNCPIFKRIFKRIL